MPTRSEELENSILIQEVSGRAHTELETKGGRAIFLAVEWDDGSATSFFVTHKDDGAPAETVQRLMELVRGFTTEIADGVKPSPGKAST